MTRMFVLATLPESWEPGQKFELDYYQRNCPPARMRAALLRRTTGVGDRFTGWRVWFGGTHEFVSEKDLAQDIRRLGGGAKAVKEMRQEVTLEGSPNDRG